MKGSAIDQTEQKSFEVWRQDPDLRLIPLGVHMDDAGLPVRPAHAVVEQDAIVSGRRRLSDLAQATPTTLAAIPYRPDAQVTPLLEQTHNSVASLRGAAIDERVRDQVRQLRDSAA